MDMVEEDRTAHLAPMYIQRMAGIRMQQMGMGVGSFLGPPLAHGDPAPLGPKGRELKREDIAVYQ